MARSPPSILVPPSPAPMNAALTLRRLGLRLALAFRGWLIVVDSIVIAERGGKRFELQDAARPFGQDDAASAARAFDDSFVVRIGDDAKRADVDDAALVSGGHGQRIVALAQDQEWVERADDVGVLQIGGIRGHHRRGSYRLSPVWFAIRLLFVGHRVSSSSLKSG